MICQGGGGGNLRIRNEYFARVDSRSRFDFDAQVQKRIVIDRGRAANDFRVATDVSDVKVLGGLGHMSGHRDDFLDSHAPKHSRSRFARYAAVAMVHRILLSLGQTVPKREKTVACTRTTASASGFGAC